MIHFSADNMIRLKAVSGKCLFRQILPMGIPKIGILVAIKEGRAAARFQNRLQTRGFENRESEVPAPGAAKRAFLEGPLCVFAMASRGSKEL